VPTQAAERAWAKILTAMDQEPRQSGRCGCIPVYDGSEWKVFRNYLTIYQGAENCADPAKVDVLRLNVIDLLDHYPDTIPQLEKLGTRVRALLNRRIETFDDVLAWSYSPFNVGPVASSKPPATHISETVQLAYDDFIIEVKSGKESACVVPAAPRGEGVNATFDFTIPGSKKRYGPRHEFTKAAFAKQLPKQLPKKQKPPRYRGKTAEDEPQRPRGRPRLDGLVPGSPEAKRADRKKERERKARRDAREARGREALIASNMASVRRHRLSRKSERQQQAAS
jgi:hypothetical protein